MPRFLAFLALLGLASPAIGPALHAQVLRIDAIKANYIEGFVDFVRWEPRSDSDPLAIGVIGAKELARNLQDLAADRSSAPRLSVHAAQLDDDLSGFDLLVVGSGNRPSWPALVELGREHGILLIGEEDGFVEQGGCIEFVVRRNRLRFIISRENVERCGLEVSSKLVEIAVN